MFGKNGKFFRFGVLACIATAPFSFAGSPTVKVDFDMSGRNSSEVSEPNYIPWVVSGVSSKDTTVSGVKITVAKGNAGSALKANWYKAGIQSPSYAKLVCDGIKVDGGDNGGEISLTFANLPNGSHTLLAYLNNVDAPEAYTYSNIDVYVNDAKQKSVKPTNRALSTEASAYAFVSFNVENGNAKITFKPSTENATFRNVTLNGFALNVSDAASQASAPVPANLDEHAAHSNGALELSWTAAKNAQKHQVYLGIDSAAVLSANSRSAEYKGEQTGTSYKVSGATPLQPLYWRIDEVDASGNVTKGDVWRFRAGRLAFDGAEGYGRNALGGRGGKTVYVTNLNDSGAGSFREAVTNDIGPRTIVFKVAGVIQLKSRLVLSSNYVTVAGQTAPGKGITITGAPFGITGNDCVVRFMRVRRGFASNAEEQNRGLDGMGITGANHSIVDHSSISWTTDEGFSSRGAKNITLQRTLISEALNIADHPNYPTGTGHGYAATIGGEVGSFHHNLLAHNAGRNWSMGGGLDGAGNYAGKLDIFNNVVYNWVNRVTDGGAHNVNFVGNYYKEGPATTLHGYTLRAQLEGTGGGTQEYYYHNNILQAANGSFTCDGNNDNCGREYEKYGAQVLNWTVFVNKPYFDSYATVQSATAAYKDVLSDVGLNRENPDDHDARVIAEAKNGTYKYTGSVGKMPGIPDRESDVGGLEDYPSVSWANDFDSDSDGLPNWWESMYGYNPKSNSGDFSDANKDRLGDGWTELERYMEWMARAHCTFETDGETQVIDLSQFTKGYDGGTFSVSDIPDGVTATVNGSKVTLKLANTFAGAGYFKFTLKDKAGDTFSRQIGVTNQKPVALTPVAESSSSAAISSSGSEPVSSASNPSSSSAGPAEGTGESSSSISGTERFNTPATSGDFRYNVSRGVIVITGLPSTATISVTDLSGKNRMLSKTVEPANGATSLSLENFAQGIYLVNVRTQAHTGKSQHLNKTFKVLR